MPAVKGLFQSVLSLVVIPLTMKEATDLYPSYIANCVFNAFSSYTAIMLNGITIHAIRKTSLLSKPLNTVLLSLAVSYLGVRLLVQPFYIAYLVMGLKQKNKNKPALIKRDLHRILHHGKFIFFSFVRGRGFLKCRQILSHSSSSQIPGTCDLQACCSCGDFNLGVLCNSFVGCILDPRHYFNHDWFHYCD